MGQNFISCDRGQTFLLPPSLTDWLAEDHLVWSVLGAVDQMDLDRFYGAYRANGQGRAAYDPRMMVGLLLYAYCVGARSSRQIERACHGDVAFKVITAMQIPDHFTIAEFRRRHQDLIAELFVDVLALCAEAGLVRLGEIAVDGTKMHASASYDRNRGYASIVEEILEEAEQIDRAEDERFGDARGDELPEQLRTRDGRRATGRMRNGRRFGAPPHPYVPPLVPEGKINTTDPDSAVMIQQGQPPMQGYNAQAAVTTNQIIVAAEITNIAPDFGQLEPVVRAAIRDLASAGVNHTPGTVLADAGYWHKQQIERIVSDGMQVLVPPDSGLREGARPGWEGGFYAFMRRVLSSDAGHAIYAKRKHSIEPVFGQIKYNRRIDGFKRRGRSAVRSEWRLIAASHNLLKLHSHWIAPTTG